MAYKWPKRAQSNSDIRWPNKKLFVPKSSEKTASTFRNCFVTSFGVIVAHWIVIKATSSLQVILRFGAEDFVEHCFDVSWRRKVWKCFGCLPDGCSASWSHLAPSRGPPTNGTARPSRSLRSVWTTRAALLGLDSQGCLGCRGCPECPKAESEKSNSSKDVPESDEVLLKHFS